MEIAKSIQHKTTALRELTDSEKITVLSFFASGDYVFDLTPKRFSELVVEWAGVELCHCGRVSIGDAIRSYVNEVGHPDKTLAMLSGLISYYRNRYSLTVDRNPERAALLVKCERIISDAIGAGVSLKVQSTLLGNPKLSHLKRQIVIAQDDVAAGMYPEALCEAKSALEGVAKFALIGSSVKPHNESKLSSWFASFKQEYRIPEGLRNGGSAFGDVVGGLCRTVEAIEFLRNQSSVAHGRPEPDSPIKEYQARLYVNAVTTLCDFILSVVAERGRVDNVS